MPPTHRVRTSLIALAAAALALAATPSPSSTPLTPDERKAILARTATIRLEPGLGGLSSEESDAVRLLLRAGTIVQALYEQARHPQALETRVRIQALARTKGEEAEARQLADLYRLNSGPIITKLDNIRVPILPGVDPVAPGANMYPWQISAVEIERWINNHPNDRTALLDPLTVVRRGTAASLRADLATLDRNPALAALNPSLAADLRGRLKRPDETGFYAVPQSLAWADSLARVSALLHEAAARIAKLDPEFSGYLKLKAQDLLANDYEGGDAAWVTGHFKHLNAQIGSYESYDDALFGVKAFPSFSLLLRDRRASDALLAQLGGLQALEDAMPYTPHKRVRDQISVGIYDVIADFGQARGTNTATILPNDPHLVERYGRTILMRRNILLDPVTIASARASWKAAVMAEHVPEYDAQAGMQRVLWHEIGHYLGPNRTKSGEPVEDALRETADKLEELKADLAALYVVDALQKQKYYDQSTARGVYAAGILRTLNKTKPRTDETYSVMQLMQFNWYLDKGVLALDPASHHLLIRYDRYHDAAGSMLREVMAIQQSGNRDAAQHFIDRWASWDMRHERLASMLRAAESSRFRLVRYAALGE